MGIVEALLGFLLILCAGFFLILIWGLVIGFICCLGFEEGVDSLDFSPDVVSRVEDDGKESEGKKQSSGITCHGELIIIHVIKMEILNYLSILNA